MLAYLLEGVQVEACFGDGVNEDEVESFEGVGELPGDEESGMGGVEALDLFFERVAEAFFYCAVEDVAVMGGEMVGKAQAKGGFTGFGQAIDHSGKAHGGIAHELFVFSPKADGLKVHDQEVLQCGDIGRRAPTVYIQIVQSTLRCSSIISLLLTSDFNGSKYVLYFVSNHIAVCHWHAPILAVTLSLPQPSSCHWKYSLISLLNSCGNEMKCQAEAPWYFQTLAQN